MTATVPEDCRLAHSPDGIVAASREVLPEGADVFAGSVINLGAAVRVPGLLGAAGPDVLYRIANRQGVAVTAIPTTSLSGEDLHGLLRFRLAQYFDVGFVDRQVAYARQMRTEPSSAVGAGDVHVVAGVPGTGEILCYAVVEEPPAAPPGCRLRSAGRALFPVEQVHGVGLFNRLPILPDLPVAKIREMGRFVRNQRPAAGQELAARAAVEVCVAVFRLMSGPLRMDVDAVIGDLEENVAKRNLDFLHVPCVVMHGTVPCADGGSYLEPRYQRHAVYPFACLVSDIVTAMPRLHDIEEALAKPGELGLLALLRLRTQGTSAPSTLRPSAASGEEPALSLPQPQISMAERRRLVEQGSWLRDIPVFTGLSAAEAALLSTRLQRVRVTAGHVIARQGEQADALYIIESGQARLDLADGAGPPQRIATAGPGQCCGHAAILDSAEHPVSVTAVTDMTLLRLSMVGGGACLTPFPDVMQRLDRDALVLLADVDHRRRLRAQVSAGAAAACGCGEGCACDSAGGHQADLITTERRES